MANKAIKDFQIFVKPAGAACNLACSYCYYRDRPASTPEPSGGFMTIPILKAYIRQQIEATQSNTIRFSWHGGEPTLMGLDFFKQIVEIQKRYLSAGQQILNGIQTNGILLNEKWCSFFAKEGFQVGLSLDGPAEIHDRHRVTRNGEPTFQDVMKAFDLLQLYDIRTDILTVITAHSVGRPDAVYSFFKHIGATFINFLPLVNHCPESFGGVTSDSVSAEAFGSFLCHVFDAWKREDIEDIKVEIFEEAARTAFGQMPAVCVYRPTCGDVPVVESNGDFYACDHFVAPEYRYGSIMASHLSELLENPSQTQFGIDKQTKMASDCKSCDVLHMCHGGCPKDRFVNSMNGKSPKNYLCPAYKRFFNHCRPFLSALTAVHEHRKTKGAM